MENLYTLIMRAVLVAAGMLALAAGATAVVVGSPELLIWVGVAIASGVYARLRLRSSDHEPVVSEAAPSVRVT